MSELKKVIQDNKQLMADIDNSVPDLENASSTIVIDDEKDMSEIPFKMFMDKDDMGSFTTLSVADKTLDRKQADDFFRKIEPIKMNVNWGYASELSSLYPLLVELTGLIGRMNNHKNFIMLTEFCKEFLPHIDINNVKFVASTDNISSVIDK